MMEDCVHYIAQLLWVVGNMMWAIGNVFVNNQDDNDDAAYYIFDMSEAARARMRYFASWMLFVAYWPLIILYMVWIPMTFKNVFDDRASTIHFREQTMFAARKTEILARMSHANTPVTSNTGVGNPLFR
ncbi:hypothetical protein EON63_07225 [archaeon]|nr:MAG: hypothetical protein EON63_07225 [archaeon]